MRGPILVRHSYDMGLLVFALLFVGLAFLAALLLVVLLHAGGSVHHGPADIAHRFDHDRVSPKR